MSTDGADVAAPDDLDAAIADIYGGPLDEFVSARDALARTLRAAGRRDEAGQVRKLTKPKRLAWALDAAALADRAAFERVEAAAEALAAARSGADMREATNGLRTAARSLAEAASARAAAAGGAAMDQSELVPALLAVAADPEALTALRAGRLVDVPVGGAFGAFAPGPRGAAATTSRRPTAAADATTTPSPAARPEDHAPPDRQGRRVPARELRAADRAVERAESEASAARASAEDAAGAAESAAADLEAAEDRRRTAQREVEAARERLDEARREARHAAAEAQEAQEVVQQARAARAALG